MAKDRGPTVRRRRLAGELEKLREATGLTREEVAERLDWHATKIWRIETARSGVHPRDMRDLPELYDVAEPRREALIRLARQTRRRGWWTAYNDVFTGSYVELEADASSLRVFDPLLVPGLLQTEGYVRAVTRGALVADVDRHVAARTTRQRLLDQPDAPAFWAVIDEAALRRPVGGPDVMREQLDHLIEMSKRENVTLQALPMAAGAHPGLGGRFVLLDFPDDLPVAYLETATDNLYLEEPDEIARYTLIFDRLRARALGPDESITFIATMKDYLD